MKNGKSLQESINQIMQYAVIVIMMITALIFSKIYIDILVFDLYLKSPVFIAAKIALLVLTLLFYVLIYLLLTRCSVFIEKHARIILLCFVLFLAILQLVLGYRLQITPQYDFSAVYHGALEWLVTGTFRSFYEYYYYYPNNFGEMIVLLFWFFCASRIGVQDFYFAGMVLNVLLCSVMVICVYLIIEALLGRKDAVFGLCIMALCPPLYIMAPVYYTDQLTMAFIPVIIWLSLLLYRTKKRWLQEGLILLLTLIAFVGYDMKPTVFISVIAVLLFYLMKQRWKLFLLLTLHIVVFFFTFLNLQNAYIYSRHLEPAIAKELNSPIELWVYMGLNENVGFSWDDTLYAREFTDPDERKEAIREGIADRIREYGFAGMMKHLKAKSIFVYSDGTFELSYTFLFGFLKENPFEDYITTNGSHYEAWWQFCTFPWYTTLLLFVSGALAVVFDEKSRKLFPVFLALFGLYLFLMLWEVHPRYIVNYYAAFVIAAVCGMRFLTNLRMHKRG